MQGAESRLRRRAHAALEGVEGTGGESVYPIFLKGANVPGPSLHCMP